MADAYSFFPIDFVFGFSSANGSAGGSYVTGSSSAYYWRANGDQSTSPFTLDAESVAEIVGMEVFGPFDGSNNRLPIRYVTPLIDGNELDSIHINHLMCPGYYVGYNQDPIGLGGMRYGHAAVNIGFPLLLGGDPAEATPKIGPGESLSMKAVFPTTTEGGTATISTDMVVRVWVVMVKGENKLRTILDYYHGAQGTGKFDGNSLDCSFSIGDLESGAFETFQNVVGSAGGFRVDDWTQIHGGSDSTRPKVMPFMTYGVNRGATTSNQWYQFTMDGTRVYYDWQELLWRYTKSDALRVTHVGVYDGSSHLRDVRLYRSNRAQEYIFNVASYNPLPFPVGLARTSSYIGPARLPRSFTVWNENASVEIRDDGTSISANNVIIGLYGKAYEMA